MESGISLNMTRLVAAITTILFSAFAASPVLAAPADISDLEKLIENIIKLLTPAAAVAFLLMVIVGAYKFITSGGDQKGTAGARTTLTYAFLGILLVAAAVLILRVLGEITSGNENTFLDVTIPNP